MSAPATSPDLRPERGRHDKEGRQRALIDAATSVFAEHGYDAATTRAVSERAGCSEGLIHRYFGGKEGLLIAVLEQKASDTLGAFEAQIVPSNNLAADLEMILLTYLQSIWEGRESMRISVSRSCIDSEVGRTISELFERPRTAVVQRVLEAHRDAGRIDPGADLDAAASMLSGIGFSAGFVLQVAFGVERAIVEQRLRGTAAIIARGLAPHTADP